MSLVFTASTGCSSFSSACILRARMVQVTPYGLHSANHEYTLWTAFSQP